jgi:hypothetical protein
MTFDEVTIGALRCTNFDVGSAKVPGVVCTVAVHEAASVNAETIAGLMNDFGKELEKMMLHLASVTADGARCCQNSIDWRHRDSLQQRFEEFRRVLGFYCSMHKENLAASKRMRERSTLFENSQRILAACAKTFRSRRMRDVLHGMIDQPVAERFQFATRTADFVAVRKTMIATSDLIEMDPLDLRCVLFIRRLLEINWNACSSLEAAGCAVGDVGGIVTRQCAELDECAHELLRAAAEHGDDELLAEFAKVYTDMSVTVRHEVLGANRGLI